MTSIRALASPVLAGLLRCVLPFGVLAASESARAQDDLPLHRRVLRVVEQPDGTVVALVEGRGLRVGDRGEAWSVYQLEERDGGGDLLGAAEVLAVGDSARVRVVLAQPDRPEGTLLVGDGVALPARVPAHTFRGPVLRAHLDGLVFLGGAADAPLYGLDEVWAARDADDERALLARLADAVRWTAGQFAADLDTAAAFAALREPRPRGRYVGRTAAGAMREATADELGAFLDFVTTYPGKYLGGTWRASEIFATWVLNDAPLGSATLLAALDAAPDDPARDALLEEELDGSAAFIVQDWRRTADALALAPDDGDAHAERIRALADYAEAWQQAREAAAFGGDYGTALIMRGRFSDALAHYEAALAAADADVVRQGWAVWGMGNARTRMGEIESGLALHARADSLFTAAGDTAARVAPLNGMGNAYYFQGDYARARAYFLEALALERHLGAETPNTITFQMNIGETFLDAGALDEAEPWLTDALALADRLGDAASGAQAAILLGKLRLAQRRLDEAEPLFVRTADVARQSDDAELLLRTRGEMGRLHLARGDRKAAARALAEAVALAGSPHFRWEPLYTLALLRQEQGRDAEAIGLLQDAVDALEQIRDGVAGGAEAQRLFVRDGPRAAVYQALVRALQRAGRAEEAFAVAQRALAEDEQAQWARAATAGSAQADALAEARALRARLDAAEAAEAEARAEGDASAEAAAQVRAIAQADYLRFVRETIRPDPLLRTLVPEGVSLDRLIAQRAEIPPDAAVALYLVGPTRMFVFLVTPDTVALHDLAIPYGEVEGLVSDLRAHLARRPGADGRDDRSEIVGAGDDDTPTASREAAEAALYRLLIAPIEGGLAGRTRLAVVPGGPLQLLPFAALRAPDGAFLAERLTLSTVPDLSVFGDAAAPAPLHIRAFGNADGTLAFAEAEVADLAELYPGAEVYVHAAATEDLAAAPAAFNVLHFATHGTLDYADVARSYLTLAPNAATGADGRLELREIEALVADRAAWPYRLVTLSACNSAVGDQSVAGWPVNPAQRFLIGARAVVASLWAVDDAATGRLMRAFYERLPTMDAAAALQAAQRELMAEPAYADPYYWAAFVALGNDR